MAKSVNALASLISLIHGDTVAVIAQLGEAFTADYSHFARANNRQPLNVAVTMLAKSKKDQAIHRAISDGYKAGALAVGYIGAQSGAFDKQPDDVKASFNDAITRAGEAFTQSLTQSGAFDAPVKKTDAEKEKAKTEKQEKANEALNAAITAKIQAGELVRAIDVKPFPQAEIDALKAEIEALTMALTEMTAQRDALQLASTAKPKGKKATA